MWAPQLRKTQSGTTFSPYWPSSTDALCSATFDLGPLLRESIAREGTEEEDTALFPPQPPLVDDQGVDDLPVIDDSGVDEFSPASAPRPAKRVRLEDVPRRNGHRHAKRQKQREAAFARTGHVAQQPTLLAQVAANAAAKAAIHATLDATNLDTARGAYAGKKGDLHGGKKRRTLAEILAMGFRLLPWNGFDSRPIIDAKGRIIAVLAGQPRDPTYAAAAADVFAAMNAERTAAQFPATMSKQPRGRFPALNTGLFYGKGQRVPSRLRTGIYGALLQRLVGNPNVKRMAGFASAAFNLWAPRVYQYYRAHADALQHHLPHLRPNFSCSVFSSAAFNFGPDVWTFKHRDLLNLPFGWCAVLALGRFDPRKGGHLVLWDLKLVIEFPAGATILFPSATISHSNIPVQDGDERASFTQYTSGGLMRYVDNGFRTESELHREDPAAYERMCEDKGARWDMGVGLFSTVDELLEPVLST
ncbi:hypothetical protein C8R43DRAFT_958011 [Mycena crocata]|nr:hypothetical protein C8R43DRAFT_958011 [Mycena crocata]